MGSAEIMQATIVCVTIQRLFNCLIKMVHIIKRFTFYTKNANIKSTDCLMLILQMQSLI